jgi:N6-L-threonylcarbamoyladenine synthase
MMIPSKHLILAIETSCDETAAAVFDSQTGIRSSVLFSQIALHSQYGGVVPETASRSQLEKISGIVTQALDAAQITLDDIDSIAVTTKPGLPGSLLVGVSFAKALAWAAQKKLIGIDHLEGHAFSPFLQHTVPFPHIALTASGGHTALYIIEDFGVYRALGQTLDDAAGEAFDKIAKLLGFGYPGGPIIETLAEQAGFSDFSQYPRSMHGKLDFSFSGLKTAVLYDLVRRGCYDLEKKERLATLTEQVKQEVASSLLVCVKDIFIEKCALAYKLHPEIKAVTFAGGVACNKYIVSQLKRWCHERAIGFFAPSAKYCTDNAAMIAFVANYKAQQGKFDDLTLDIF